MYIYKSAKDYIIKLELSIDDSVFTNMDRIVKNKEHAKYRCNKARVVQIYNKHNNQKINSISSDHDFHFIYNVGDIVEVYDYDKNTDNTCSNGIHFYLTEETAYYHELLRYCQKYTGEYKSWYDDGGISRQCVYLDGMMHGKCIDWYKNGKIHRYSTCENGEQIGEYIMWHDNGNIAVYVYEQEKYLNGEKNMYSWYRDGKPKEYILCNKFQMKWNNNGELIKKLTYVNGILYDIWHMFYDNGKIVKHTKINNDKWEEQTYEWHKNGKPYIFYTCVNDQLHGEYVVWDNDGQIIKKCTYVNGILNGDYIEWYDNGTKFIYSVYNNGILYSRFIN